MIIHWNRRKVNKTRKISKPHELFKIPLKWCRFVVQDFSWYHEVFQITCTKFTEVGSQRQKDSRLWLNRIMHMLFSCSFVPSILCNRDKKNWNRKTWIVFYCRANQPYPTHISKANIFMGLMNFLCFSNISVQCL